SSEEPGLAVGFLEEGLLLEAPLSYYREQLAQEQDRFQARRASPFVGGVSATALHGSDVLLVATNHAELVRLKSDWQTIETMLPFDTADNENLPLIGYGSLLIDGDMLLVSYRFGKTVGISEVDLRSWRLVRQQFYADRFAAFPQACFLNDQQLALVTTEGVSVVDRATLAERQFVRLEGGPVGLACVEGAAWITDTYAARGWIVDASGSLSASFSWAGRGSNTLAYSIERERVYGTDPVGKSLFECDVKTRACTASDPIGDKPTNLLVDGDTVYVTLELSGAVALVRADDLKLTGRVGFPGSPRTLTLIPSP
ncbi:MAG: hypothetical protein HYU28_01510, partial [Actinobacteria bacterium]|nr:hypothetical protein [Actinomycetota bacterium]